MWYLTFKRREWVFFIKINLIHIFFRIYRECAYKRPRCTSGRPSHGAIKRSPKFRSFVEEQKPKNLWILRFFPFSSEDFRLKTKAAVTETRLSGNQGRVIGVRAPMVPQRQTIILGYLHNCSFLGGHSHCYRFIYRILFSEISRCLRITFLRSQVIFAISTPCDKSASLVPVEFIQVIFIICIYHNTFFIYKLRLFY